MGKDNVTADASKKNLGSHTLTCPTDEAVKEFKYMRQAVAFFIGGAGDKESYYGFGPKYNVDRARKPFTESVKLAIWAAGVTSYHLGYNEVIGDEKIKANVLDVICKSDAVYIVGHSLGGWNGAHLSSYLAKLGYSVKVLVTLDPVGKGALVGSISNIYPDTPQPSAGLWVNVLAQSSDSDMSDWIAGIGEQWRLESGPNVNSVMDVNHESAAIMFTTVLADGKSALNYVINSLNKHFRGEV